MLYVLITTLGPVSGAHFNPAVTLAFALRREHPSSQIMPYVVVQIIGGILGVWFTHIMFDLPIMQKMGQHVQADVKSLRRYEDFAADVKERLGR